MSSLSASLCLFSAALCNVGVLDQHIFEQGSQPVHNQQQGQLGNGALINTATNLFNQFAGGLGGYNNNNNNNNYQNRPAQGQKPRTPHQSPCPKKFQYVTDGREWKGIIRLKNVDVNHDTLLEADFLVPGHGGGRRVSQTCSDS